MRSIIDACLHYLFPHICSGCGADVLPAASSLCIKCMSELPETGFEKYNHNPVEKKFWGRLNLVMASSQYYFTRHSLIQHLMHQFKYKSDRNLGLQLGRLMGQQLINSKMSKADALVPLPLFPSREKKRGYNQARILCEGMAETMQIPILDKAVRRNEQTITQTRKSRIERWQNMNGKFAINDFTLIDHKHILLVDDVITTGATLEACGSTILNCGSTSLSIATLCVAGR